jgi:hypothetical protein
VAAPLRKLRFNSINVDKVLFDERPEINRSVAQHDTPLIPREVRRFAVVAYCGILILLLASGFHLMEGVLQGDPVALPLAGVLLALPAIWWAVGAARMRRAYVVVATRIQRAAVEVVIGGYYVVIVVLTVAVALGVLYAIVRFVKWAWMN